MLQGIDLGAGNHIEDYLVEATVRRTGFKIVFGHLVKRCPAVNWNHETGKLDTQLFRVMREYRSLHDGMLGPPKKGEKAHVIFTRHTAMLVHPSTHQHTSLIAGTDILDVTYSDEMCMIT